MTDIYTLIQEKMTSLEANYKEKVKLDKESAKLRADIEKGNLTATKETELKEALARNSEATLILEERNALLFITVDEISQLTNTLSEEATEELAESYATVLKHLKDATTAFEDYTKQKQVVISKKENKKNDYAPYVENTNHLYFNHVTAQDELLVSLMDKINNRLQNI